MIQTIKKFTKVFLIVDLLLIIGCLVLANSLWILNTQIAFVSSLIVSVATFLSYQNNVKKRLENEEQNIDTINDRDSIDEMDDTFDLYSENEPIMEEKELSASEIKTIIQEEKSKVKQNSFKNLFKSTTTFVSMYRIIGYTILVVGFFYLVNNKIFVPYAYLVGLFVVPFSMLIMKLVFKNDTKSEEAGQ